MSYLLVDILNIVLINTDNNIIKIEDIKKGLGGKYKVVYHEETPLYIWHVVGCGSRMRGVHSIFLGMRTNNDHLHHTGK
jgi:hypothetical protein